MFKLAGSLVSLLLVLPLCAQEPPLLPEDVPQGDDPLPMVDTITPVPAPEIPLGAALPGMESMPESLKIDNKGGTIEGDLESGIRFGGPVKVQGDNGLEIFADTALWDKKEEKVTLEGNVTIYQGNSLNRGEKAVYYYVTKKLDTTGLRASVDPMFLESGKFRTEYEEDGRQVLVGEDAGITTHDVEKPDFWLRAKETRVYPNDKVTFKNMRLYAGEVPIFWLPYLSQPLDSELGYHFEPGGKSSWGPYLLNYYGIMLGGERNAETGENKDAWLLTTFRFDILTRRGVGTGLDLQDKRLEDQGDEIKGLSLYYLKDADPTISRSGVTRESISNDRYGIKLQQRQLFDMPDDAEWRADVNLNFLSDRYYREDYEPELYQDDPYPDNTAGIFRRDQTSLLSLYGRFRINDFYRSDTRLPEIAFDQARRPLFGLPILHEGTTSVGVIGVEAADFKRSSVIDPLLSLPPGDPRANDLLDQLQGYERELALRIRALSPDDPRIEGLRAQLLDSDFTRFHTYQDFSLPMMLGGWLSVTPQAGVGHTRYWSADGPSSSIDRTLLHAGTEVSLKFSKDFGDFQDHGWGLNGLRHVLQPYANWSLLSADSAGEDDPRIDRLTFSTRPRPLSPSRYTAIDDLQSWNTLRLGTRNRLLTKRDGQTHEWLFLDTYMDGYLEDSELDRTFSNLYNDLRFRPLPWMSIDVETQLPVFGGGDDFSEFSGRLTLMPTENFEFSVGYRVLDDHPVLVDSNRIDLRTYTRLQENWGLGTRHVLETDDGVLESQQYMLHRDFGSWVGGVGITHRDNRLREELGVMFSLTLKDFPAASLPFSLDAE
jgi:LPS-assembly protein